MNLAGLVRHGVCRAPAAPGYARRLCIRYVYCKAEIGLVCSEDRIGIGGLVNLHAVIVAGPNGAGKTTFAREYLEVHPCPYISADVIADGMDADTLEEVRIRAGRRFFEQVAAQIEKRESFVVESTLSGLTFREVTKQFKEAGYSISIAFIFLRTAEACCARIHERVRKGGHPVAETDIRRRFPRSVKNFWHEYRHLADRWHLFYNGGAQFHEVALGEGNSFEVRDEDLFAVFLGVAGEVPR
jgi:predicted ABC-type ATPase